MRHPHSPAPMDGIGNLMPPQLQQAAPTSEPGKPSTTKVVLTVDVEASVAGAFGGNPAHTPLIHEPIAGEVGGRSEGLGFLIETLNEYGLIATFFVETVQTRYFSDRIMGGYVNQLLQAGQDVQLHLHPQWLSFQDGRLGPSGRLTDQCAELDVPQLIDLISNGAERIIAWTGKRPIGMRAGNCSVAISVFEAMRRAGLGYSSNICIALNPAPGPELALAGGIHCIAGICELPITCFVDSGPLSRGRLRPMQVTALTASEQIELLSTARACGNPVVVIITHPFEFIKKHTFRYTNISRNQMVQRRFQCLCKFLADNKDKFEVLPLVSAADALKYHQAWHEINGNWITSISRSIQNFLNDRVSFI